MRESKRSVTVDMHVQTLGVLFRRGNAITPVSRMTDSRGVRQTRQHDDRRAFARVCWDAYSVRVKATSMTSRTQREEVLIRAEMRRLGAALRPYKVLRRDALSPDPPRR